MAKATQSLPETIFEDVATSIRRKAQPREKAIYEVLVKIASSSTTKSSGKKAVGMVQKTKSTASGK